MSADTVTEPGRALVLAVLEWLRSPEGHAADLDRLTVQRSIDGQPQACCVVREARGVRYRWWTWDGERVVRHE